MPYLEIPTMWVICWLIGFGMGAFALWLIEKKVREHEKEKV